MAPRKIPIATIEQLQRTLESKPECHIEEVTKVEAIRMLSAQIHAMRSKGYGLRAIADVLSENGVAVTAVTLKGYLKKFKSAGGREVRAQEGKSQRTERQPDQHARRRVGIERGGARRRGSFESEGRPGESCWGARGGIFGDSQRGRSDLQGEAAICRGGRSATVGVRAEGGHEGHLSAESVQGVEQ